jgi:HK97 family phage prohead protease
MAPLIERRFISQIEARAAAAGERRMTGYASVFDSPTQIGDPRWGFTEVFAPGAFTKTLREQDIVALCDHDPAKPLSRMSAGTLTLEQDQRGLKVDSAIPETSYGNDLNVNLQNRNVEGMSVGFSVVQDEWTTNEDGSELRTVKEARLFEVSTTAFPAYTDTEAGLRSAEARNVALARMSRSTRNARRAVAMTDDDMNPGFLAQAIDAALDEAIEMFCAVDLTTLPDECGQAVALVQAAAVTIDALLIALGVPDLDEMVEEAAEGTDSQEPVMTTPVSTDDTQPPAGTRSSVNVLAMRMSALATIHGLPA